MDPSVLASLASAMNSSSSTSSPPSQQQPVAVVPGYNPAAVAGNQHTAVNSTIDASDYLPGLSSLAQETQLAASLDALLGHDSSPGSQSHDAISNTNHHSASHLSGAITLPKDFVGSALQVDTSSLATALLPASAPAMSSTASVSAKHALAMPALQAPNLFPTTNVAPVAAPAMVPTLFGKEIKLPTPLPHALKTPTLASNTASIVAQVPAASGILALPEALRHNAVGAPQAGKKRTLANMMQGGAPLGAPVSTSTSMIAFSADVSEDEGDRERRRQDRNLREQKRSQQISHQIHHLRDVLVSAAVECKPDKYSILTTVGEYIKNLQDRSSVLDTQHKSLLKTIATTAEIVQTQYTTPAVASAPQPTLAVASAAGATPTGATPGQRSSSPLEGETPGFMQGMDFKIIFGSCPFATAVTSIDGRFLDCNASFEETSGYNRRELLPLTFPTKVDAAKPLAVPSLVGAPDGATPPPPEPAAEEEPQASSQKQQPRNLSLFSILQRSDMEPVFSAMSEMLKRHVLVDNLPPEMKPAGGEGGKDFWMGHVNLCRRPSDAPKVRLNLSLVRSDQQGRPRFFNCVLLEDEAV